MTLGLNERVRVLENGKPGREVGKVLGFECSTHPDHNLVLMAKVKTGPAAHQVGWYRADQLVPA